MIIGIEGVSCTGKTMLASALASQMDAPLVVPCYYHVASDPSKLPRPVAVSSHEQVQSLAVLLEVEEVRRAHALEAGAQGRDVILDRTVDTLLAHAHAIGRMECFDCDDAGLALVRRRPVVLPDLTLLLQVPSDVLAQRAARRPGMAKIFYDPEFTSHFNAYFRQPLTPVCVVLDATLAPVELARRAREEIRGFLGDPLGGGPRERCTRRVS